MLIRLIVVCVLSLLTTAQHASATDYGDPEWALLYWMPYDSSSPELGGLVDGVQPTMGLFRKNVRSKQVVVAVQRDLRKDSSQHAGHVRSVFRGSAVPREELIAATDSADSVNLQRYLQWARGTLKAKKWAIIMLGHSGRLSELSPDEYPDQKTQRLKWMQVDELASAIERAWKETETKPDLLVLQTCTKGMIEVVYSLRNAAKLTLASQTELGGHHTSYTDFLVDLSKRPSMTGGELAQRMMDTLHPSVFLSQVIVQNPALSKLPARLEKVLEKLNPNSMAPSVQELVRYEYPLLAAGEFYSDFLALLGAYASGNEEAKLEYAKFSSWMTTVIRHRRGAMQQEVTNAEKLTGLGVLLPLDLSSYETHANLPFYRATRLWNRLPSPRTP